MDACGDNEPVVAGGIAAVGSATVWRLLRRNCPVEV